MNSDSEAFSHNPTDESFVVLAFQLVLLRRRSSDILESSNPTLPNPSAHSLIHSLKQVSIHSIAHSDTQPTITDSLPVTLSFPQSLRPRKKHKGGGSGKCLRHVSLTQQAAYGRGDIRKGDLQAEPNAWNPQHGPKTPTTTTG